MFKPETYEFLMHFKDERANWEILPSPAGTECLATDRQRWRKDDAFNAPLDVTCHQEICEDRTHAIEFVMLTCIEYALAQMALAHA